MKFIHALFVIGVSINPVIAGDYEDGKTSIEKGKYSDVINSYPKAAKEGYCKAQLYLNLMYDEDMGVKKDKIAAFLWYLKAAEHCDVDDQ